MDLDLFSDLQFASMFIPGPNLYQSQVRALYTIVVYDIISRIEHLDPHMHQPMNLFSGLLYAI
jgi:hypothetical protein